MTADFLSVFGVYDFAIRDALLLSVVALALYLMLSAGIFAVPQVGLMAVGAYMAAVLSVDAGWPVPLAVAAATAASALAALLLAALLGRLQGIYLAIASIAFSEVVRVAVLNLPVTGGAQGKVGIPREVNDIWIVVVVVTVTAGLVALRRSRTGLAIAAMREDPVMARHHGIDVVLYRIALFTASGGLAGVAGALYVHVTGFVEPGQFSFDLLTQLLAVVVIGGMTRVAGSFVGAAVIFGLPFTLAVLAEYQFLVNGALIVAVVAFAPGGILGALQGVITRVRLRRAPRAVPSADSHVVPPPPAQGRSDSPETVLDARELTMMFGGLKALDGVSVIARAGEVLGVIGPNGSGKTTLLNVLSGAYRPAAGSGSLTGHDLARLWGRPDRLADAGIARTFQTIRLMDDTSAVLNVAVGVRREDRKRRVAIARSLLVEHGLGAVADLPVGDLPYGVRRRVEIAAPLRAGRACSFLTNRQPG